MVIGFGAASGLARKYGRVVLRIGTVVVIAGVAGMAVYVLGGRAAPAAAQT